MSCEGGFCFSRPPAEGPRAYRAPPAAFAALAPAFGMPARPVRAPSGYSDRAGLDGCKGAGSGPSTCAGRVAGSIYGRTHDAGDVLTDDVDAARAAEAAAAGRARTLANVRAAMRNEVYSAADRTAGDVRAGTANGVPPGMDAAEWAAMTPAQRESWFEANASRVFDPSDPASMTEARWRSMSSEDRRAWINANVADSERRAQLIRGAIEGAFAQISEVVRTIRETRLTEIREAAATERERMRTELDAERARLEAEVARARIAADQARAEADRAAAEARNGPDAAGRAAAEAEAAAARARAAEAERAAEAAAAEAARLRAAQGALVTVGAQWSTGAMVAAGAVGVGALGLLVWLLVRWMDARGRQS